MQHRPFFTTLLACCIAFPVCDAQLAERAGATTIVGCWRIDAGRFAIVESTHVDAGQTTIPRLIHLDTLPGRTWSGASLGHLVRVLNRGASTRYGDGDYEVVAEDSVRINWSSGMVGLTLDVRADSLVMRGSATAWTDYGGEERAAVVLRRSTCRSNSRSRRR